MICRQKSDGYTKKTCLLALLKISSTSFILSFFSFQISSLSLKMFIHLNQLLFLVRFCYKFVYMIIELNDTL